MSKSKILKELMKKNAKDLVEKPREKREPSYASTNKSQPTSKENGRESNKNEFNSKENERNELNAKENTSTRSNNNYEEKNTTQVINENEEYDPSNYGSGAMWNHVFDSRDDFSVSVIDIDGVIESYISKEHDLSTAQNIPLSWKELEILNQMSIKFNGTEIMDLNEKVALIMLRESIHDPKALKEQLPSMKQQMEFTSNDYHTYPALPLPKYNIQLRDTIKELRKIQKSPIHDKQLKPIINEAIKEARKSMGITDKKSKFEYPLPERFNEITTDKSRIVTRQQVLKKNLSKSRKNPMIANQELGKNDIRRRYYHYQSNLNNTKKTVYIPDNYVVTNISKYLEKLKKGIEQANNGIEGIDNESFKGSFNNISWHTCSEFLQHHFHHFDHIIQGFRNSTFETSVDIVKSLGEKYLDYTEYCKKQNKQAVNYDEFIDALIKAAESQGLKLDPNILTENDIVLLPETMSIDGFEYISATRLINEIAYRCPNAVAQSEKTKTETTLVRFEGEHGLEKFNEGKIGVYYTRGLPVCGLKDCKDIEMHPIQLAYLLNISVGPFHQLLKDRELLENGYKYLQDKALGIKSDPKYEDAYNSWMKNYENPPDNGYKGYILTIQVKEGTELCHSKTTGGEGNPFADEVYLNEPPNDKNIKKTMEKFQDGCSYPIYDVDNGEVRIVKVNGNAPFLNVRVVVPECTPTPVNNLRVPYDNTGGLTKDDLDKIDDQLNGIDEGITKLKDVRGMGLY